MADLQAVLGIGQALLNLTDCPDAAFVEATQAYAAGAKSLKLYQKVAIYLSIYLIEEAAVNWY